MATYIHEFISRQADSSADTLAIISGEERLTYGELNCRTNQLAGYLQHLHIQPGTLVGVCMDRSAGMIVAIFAVLKAGCAYVPLDPSYPPDRLAFIIADAQIKVVVTQNQYAQLFSGTGIRALCLEHVSVEIQNQPDEQIEWLGTPENLAYVIYTSGSTGKPKGVMISHSSLVQFIRIAGAALDIQSDDVYLQTASIAYALSVRQIMIPLAKRATLVIASSEEIRDPLLLFQLIKKNQITLIDVVPSFWRTCLQRLSDLPVEELKSLMNNSLRRIVSIGEPLLSDLPHAWMSQFGTKTKLVNIFGQTETTGVVATYTIPAEEPQHVGITPIGHSIPDTKLYILDPNLEPVSTGEPGELCVSNPCLASGYLNRPELTAQKFIPNPFQDGFSERLYRTGDLARLRADGNIEYLGRGDYQVKIRGQRLELGEVETAIREYPLIKECVVLARMDRSDEKYLAAYIIPATRRNLYTSELRAFLRNRLPDYMIPSIYVFLDSLPLTPNGKLDRLALPDPLMEDVNRGNPLSSFAEPRTPIERSIAAIWKDLLKLDRLGIHDDYFDLGGHSLMAVQMFARIERELGVRLPYTSLFHATSVAQLAELVSNTNDEIIHWPIIVPIRSQGTETPFFGVHGHEGGVLFWRELIEELPPDQPFYAVQARGVDGVQEPLRRIPDMAHLYIQEMRKIQAHGPYQLGGYSMGGEIAFEMAQQLVKQGEQVCLLVMFDTRNPQRPIRPIVRVDRSSIAPQLQGLGQTSNRGILKQKFLGHYHRWSMLRPGAKAHYILNQIWNRLKHLVTNTVVRLNRLFRRRLPDSVLLSYLRQSHSEALNNYVPEIYPGKVTLFRAAESLPQNPDDSPMGWKPLAAGGLEVYHFEASHEIVRAEYAKDVARQLVQCLQMCRGD